jgi:type II secretory pathway pseudopilin PulG
MPMRPHHLDHGATVIELLLVMLLVVTLSAISAPVAASVIDASRARQAAAFLGARFRLAREQAVTAGANVGVVFDQVGGRWQVRVCRDGTRNGVRRADIQSGADPCVDGPYDLSQLFPGVDVSVDPQLRGPSGEPPSADPVRFGSSNIASFSPTGSCTAGSLFLRSRAGAQFVVRLSGIAGRLRLLWYERANGWRDR